MRAPTGVRSSTNHTTMQTTIATPMTNSRYVGNRLKPRFVAPDSDGGAAYGEPSAPAASRIESSMISTSANVNSSPYSGSSPYRRRRKNTSSTSPNSPTTTGATTSAQ